MITDKTKKGCDYTITNHTTVNYKPQNRIYPYPILAPDLPRSVTQSIRTVSRMWNDRVLPEEERRDYTGAPIPDLSRLCVGSVDCNPVR